MNTMNNGVQSLQGLKTSLRPPYRSSRAVPSTKRPSQISTRSKTYFLVACLLFLSLGYLMSSFQTARMQNESLKSSVIEKHGISRHVKEHKSKVTEFWTQQFADADKNRVIEKGLAATVDKVLHEVEIEQEVFDVPEELSVEKGPKIETALDDPNTIQQKNSKNKRNMDLARGISGLDNSKTPALVGAKRAHIQCDVDVDALAYWNNPQGERDIAFESPFVIKSDQPKYLTFEPDAGGWNNIRMSMEIIFIIAATTGRTLVMPPEQPLYLLDNDSSKKTRGFADFFPLDDSSFKNHINIISMEEFLLREGGELGLYPIPEESKEAVMNGSKFCRKMKKSKNSCFPLNDYLRSISVIAPMSGSLNCLIFDERMYEYGELEVSSQEIQEFCGNRKPLFYDREYSDFPLIHIQASVKEYRLLNHFYGFIHFTNPKIDNFYKRFVRDFLHYQDAIFCAAGKIVLAIQKESKELGFEVDEEGGGGYSSFHVRRGDLQYKKVKISGEEWQENTKDLFLPKEILYIATDEKDKSFFDPLSSHHDLRFMDDYWDYAGLGDLDPNYMGMIETIVASRGRRFVGTFFSTFSGYINRMRGYNGMSMKASFYGTKDRKTATHTWEITEGSVYAKEWPSGWIGIDGDKFVTRDIF